MSATAKENGIFASSRRLLATVLEIGQVRLELFGTEVELEKRRFFDGLLWGAAAVLTLGVGLVLLCGFVVLLFWDNYRMAALGVLTALFLGGSVILVNVARRRLRNPMGVFHVSAAELARDRDGLTTSSQHEQ